MHEFSVTSSLVKTLIDLASRQGSKRVLEVQLRIGKLRTLSAEQIKFCYGVLAKGTVLDKSELLIEETAGMLRCTACNHRAPVEAEGDLYHFNIPRMLCPLCGNPLTIEGGDECVITRVRMLKPSASAEIVR